MRLIQKMTVNATRNPTLTPKTLLNVSIRGLPVAAITRKLSANTGLVPLSALT
jgi:hypothetical protein